jgi:hydrogenase/urease accessory protein HupE
MNKFKTILLTVFVTFISPLVFAHTGHGDHAAILAQGQLHPMLGGEHVILLSAIFAGLYLALKLIRKQ